MSNLIVQINCSTRAFGRTPSQKAFELNRILRMLIKDIEQDGLTLSNGHIKLIDHNGNSVGVATFTKGAN